MPEDKPKHPLIHRELNAEEQLRLNPDLTPLDSTPAERLAAQDPGLPAKERQMEPNTTPAPAAPQLVSMKLIALAALILPVLYTASALVPPPYGPLAGGLMYVAAVLLGVALPQPKAIAGKKALIAVPALGSVAVLVQQYASSLPDGKLKGVLTGVSVVLAVLAGVSMEQPKDGNVAKTLAMLLMLGFALAGGKALADDIISQGGTLVSTGTSVDNTTTASTFALIPGNTYCAQAANGAGYLLTGSSVAGTAATAANGMYLPQNNYPCYPFKVIGDGKYVAWIPVSGSANAKIFLVRW